MAHWSLSNLHRDASLAASLRSSIDVTVLGGVLVGTLVLSVSYAILHHIYIHRSVVYRQGLSAEQRIVVIQHTIEAIFFGLILIPGTYLAASFNFESQSLDELYPKVRLSTVLLGIVVLLYCLELNSRSSSLRPMIVIHHVGACLVGVFCIFAYSEACIITGSLLVYFISYESIVFAGLVLYRLGSSHAGYVMWIGMWFFGVSRPFQVLMVFASLIANRDHIVVWQGIASVIITLAFTALQLYTVTIHYKVYKKCRHLRVDLPHQCDVMSAKEQSGVKGMERHISGYGAASSPSCS